MDSVFDQYVQRFEEGVTGELIAEVIEAFESKRLHMRTMYERYKANKQYIPSLKNDPPVKTAFDSRVANDYIGEAVDLKVGYFSGIPIAYNYDTELPEAEAANDLMQRFNRLNRIADMDSETAKWSAITGYGARLLYLDEDKRERVMNVPSFDCIFVGELTDPTAALRLYTASDVLHADVYTADSVQTWRDNDGAYTMQDEVMNPFQVVPLIGYPNNSELQGDCDKVLPIVDGIDEVLTNALSEDTAQRLAYMGFEGGKIDPETLEQARETGAFEVPTGGKVYFITKDINDQARQNLLKHLIDGFYKFTATPNLSDEAFSGNASGVALKFKLTAFNAKVTSYQRKFESSTLQMYTALSNVWQVRGAGAFDPLNVYLEFKENFPLDLLNEAQVQEKLAGLVSDEARLALFSAVDDPKWELERMREEKQSSAFMGSASIEEPTEEVQLADQFVTEVAE